MVVVEVGQIKEMTVRREESRRAKFFIGHEKIILSQNFN
jgi:hypothetical protein